MMAMDDKRKKGLAVIIASGIGKKEGQKEEESVENEKMDNEEGLEAAAEEAIVAIKNGDAKKLKEALKSFHEMCSCEEPEMESDESEME